MLTGRHKNEVAGARDTCHLFSDNSHEGCAAGEGEVKRCGTANHASVGYSLFELQAVGFLVGRCVSSKELAELLAVLHFLLRVSL